MCFLRGYHFSMSRCFDLFPAALFDTLFIEANTTKYYERAQVFSETICNKYVISLDLL